jgi:cytochrome c-type biogenesis protein CcsB
MGSLNVKFFDLGMILSGIASVLYVVYIYSKKEGIGKTASYVTLTSALVMTGAIIIRWVESYKMGIGRIPVTNLYESLAFFSWSVIVFYIFVERKYQTKTFGAFIIPISFVTMLFASTVETSIQPLVPALQSYWLHIHVLTCFIGYAAFAISSGVAVIYLLKDSKSKKGGGEKGILGMFPSIRVLDDLVYRAVIMGFPFLTAGIITGAAWANYAWGTYWSWDPKETWSLIVWLMYAAFLHARITRGWHGRKTAILSIVGFVSTIFCYLGVNLVLSGLHSYGGS